MRIFENKKHCPVDSVNSKLTFRYQDSLSPPFATPLDHSAHGSCTLGGQAPNFSSPKLTLLDTKILCPAKHTSKVLANNINNGLFFNWGEYREGFGFNVVAGGTGAFYPIFVHRARLKVG